METDRLLGGSFVLGLTALIVAAECVVDCSAWHRVAALGAVAIACPIAARVPVGTLAKRVAPLLSFGVLGAAAIAFSPTPDQSRAFITALLVKSSLALLTVTGMAALVPERALRPALAGLRVPARVADLVYSITRGMHTVGDELTRTLRARDARGRPKGWRAVTTAREVTRALMLRLARRADTQAAAMSARLFAGELPAPESGGLRFTEWLLLVALGSGLVWLALAA